MKQLTLKILVAALAIMVGGAAVAAVVWIIGSTHGARWLLTTAATRSSGGFSVRKIEGRIGDHLLLTGVRINLAQQNVELDRVELRWKPLPLLAGTIAVQELAVNGVRVQDDAPPGNKPPSLAWPHVSEFAHLFDGTIAQLRVTNLRYQRLQEQPLQVTSVAGTVTWQEGLLSINDLTVVSTSGRINGSVSARFKQPSLTADLDIAVARPAVKMDRFLVRVRHSHGAGAEQLAGMITVAGYAGTRALIELGGDVGLARDSFNLRRLRLTAPGHKGVVTGDGTLAFTAIEPFLSLQLKAAGIDLSPQLGVPASLSGTLKFAGTPDSYQGDFTVANQAEGWQSVTASAAYHGTREGMNVDKLNASILDGSLAGNIAVNWRDGFAVQGALSGKNLNPARISADWKGVANFTAGGKLSRSGKGPVTGSISGALLESRLHGQMLTGDLQASFSGNDISLSRLALQGKGFDLHASGKLNQRISLNARITDLSRLIPDSGGTLKSDGWVRWSKGRISGAGTGTGSRLAYAGTRIADSGFTVRLDQGSGYPLHAAISLRDILYAGHRVNAVTVEADGTLPRHTVSVALRSAGSEARLNVTAGYSNGIWKGAISRLDGRDDTGPWHLTAPATCAVSAGTVSLSPLVLSTGAAEQLEIAADLTLNPLGGRVRADLTKIDMKRLKPWLPHGTTLEGRISGRATGIMLPGQRFQLNGTAALSGGTLHRQRSNGELLLAFSSATAVWDWRGETLTGALSVVMTEYGQAEANFHLPIPARFPVSVTSQGSLKVSLAGKFREKGIITTLFPGLIRESSGELDTALTIDGTWEAPRIGGKLRLAKAGAYLPTAGIHLKEIQLAAHLEKNLIRIDSFRAVSGPGQIEGTALVTLDGWRVISYQGAIHGENFQTVYFPELQILSTPQLRFEGTPQKLVVRGDLRLPELHIAGSPLRTGVAPSSDVIREGKALPSAQGSPLVLDAQVRILLGEKVFIKVAGIDAQVGGTIDLSSNGPDMITSRGEIKVVKGRYRTYGVNLDIVRGRLFFPGGPVNNPSLDFLALRGIGDVRAGVTVTGTLRKPVTKLYSEPAMPDIDVLSYIVLGHQLGNNSAQASLVNQAAGALLTSGQAMVLQDKIKNTLGLSTLEIQSGAGGSAAPMGYKPLQVTPPGTIPAVQQPGITETVLTVGTYLTPQLYISYGKSLFTGSNLFLLRYDIFKRWQIETQTGNESGADLFYKLEFK